MRVPAGGQLDSKSKIPENEELVDVGEISLAPGASRQIKLNFDQPLSQEEIVSAGGELKPAIRIISFESDRS